MFNKDRVLKTVLKPIKEVLKYEDLFDSKLMPNIKKLRKHLTGEGRLDPKLVLKIIELAEKVLAKEPNLLRIDSPVNIIGDIHGQFYDLLTVFSLIENFDEYKYLFIGDFVDRGLFSFECICFLFCLKIKYPNGIFLLRGNHESRHLTRYFTFHEECLYKSNEFIYDKFMNAFDSLPLCAILDNKFCIYHFIIVSFYSDCVISF
jgi:serine/threonine-protein phosphatase 2B catalytic subunit